MKYLPANGYKRILVIFAYAGIAVLMSWLFLKYLLAPLLPFILAWITAMLLHPLIVRVSERTRLPKKVASFLVVGIVFALIIALISFLVVRAANEIGEITEKLLTGAADAVGDIFDYVGSLTEKLPLSGKDLDRETEDRIKNAVTGMVESTVSSVSSGIPDAVVGFVTSLPGVILFTVALILATFYMGNDISHINAFLASRLPESSRKRLSEAKRKLLSAGIRYVKAYLMILCITFAQLFVGFMCLKIPYALTLAALIALIDILPVLGVGTVLIPWSAVLLIRRNTYLGIGLLIVFAVIWLIRQIIEPRIVGKSTGLSPLITLIAMYTGVSLMGFAGLFVFPISVMLIKNLYDMGMFGKNGTPSADQHQKNARPR